jgi:prepilin-type processing-associated H-X9-DG protein
MRQLGMAFQQYFEDNDEVMPNAAAGGTAGVGAVGGWIYYSAYTQDGSGSRFDPSKGGIYPYLESKAVYRCPDDGNAQNTGDSYAYNSCLTSPSIEVAAGAGRLWPGKPLSIVPSPSGTLLLAEEGTDVLIWSSSTNDGLFNMDANPGYDYQAYTKRHSGGSHALFLDSHVKWMHYDKLVSSQLPTGGAGNICMQ